MTTCRDLSKDVSRWIDSVQFDERGLVPAVVQDDRSGTVLTVAWVNKEAIRETIGTGRTVFWSRSRGELWRKGETSGNYQIVKDILYDCDNDSLVIKVDPAGPACHTGHSSCFYRSALKADAGGEIPGRDDRDASDVLAAVYGTVQDRKKTLPSGSYVASLMIGGQDRILKKVAEEAGEVMLASKNGGHDELVREMADLWFHCLVTLGFHDIEPGEILAELGRRRKPR